MLEAKVNVVGSPIDPISWDSVTAVIRGWSRARESRVICICNAHSLVIARRSADFSKVLESADLATPDGAPIAFLLRKLGHPRQERINGPDLMLRYCQESAASGEAIYLYGSSERTLELLIPRLLKLCPGLRIAGFRSPPFRELTQEEDEAVVAEINASGAGVVWVGLGCPKQETWMSAHRGRVNAVMIGVGAAFDYHAGTLRRAPLWMQDHGLEWLYRLMREPRRLWRRYLVTNSLFIWYAAGQLLRRS